MIHVVKAVIVERHGQATKSEADIKNFVNR